MTASALCMVRGSYKGSTFTGPGCGTVSLLSSIDRWLKDIKEESSYSGHRLQVCDVALEHCAKVGEDWAVVLDSKFS